MSSSDIAISVRGLSKSYTIAHNEVNHSTLAETMLHRLMHPLTRATKETFWALKDVSFDVKRGEVVGIIGRNGAGKSTLLKVLSRITEPTSGEVELRGRVGSLLEVGTGFHPELTGRENVYLNGAILGMRKAEIKKQFDAIVDFSGVDKFLDTPVKRYSSGMYVRLAFAVAAHLEPEILVVDEVLAVGDAEFQRKCLGKINQVATDGRTVLFVSHNIAVMRSLCQEIVWLERGQPKMIGPSVEVSDSYLKTNYEAAKSFVELQSVQRSGHYGERVKLTSLEWSSEMPLVHGTASQVSANFEAYADVKEFSIGIGFSLLDGTRLLTYETDLVGPRPDIRKGGKGSARVAISRLPLSPGHYLVDIGARSGDLYGIDYLPAFTRVEVVAGRDTSGNVANSGAGVRIPADTEWQFNNEKEGPICLNQL